MLEVKPELAADSLVNQMLSQPSVLQNGLIPTLAMRIYQESKANDSAARIVVEGLFLELLGQASRSLHRPHLRPPEWLKSARDLCHEHFNDQLQLSQIATTVGVHPTHLARCFRKHYRMTDGD